MCRPFLCGLSSLEDGLRAQIALPLLPTWTALEHGGPNHLGIVMRCAPRASDGPNHLGFVTQIALSKPFGDQELFRYDDDGAGHPAAWTITRHDWP